MLRVFCVAALVVFVQAVYFGQQKCCGDLGCFYLGYPWSYLLRPVPPPKCQDECPVKFYMFSRPKISQNTTISGWPITSLKDANFNGNKTTVVFVHGWWYSSESFLETKNIFLNIFDVNFIFVDFGKCAQDGYLQAVSTSRTIAAQAVRFLKYLIKEHGASTSRMHIIGVSLGAQVAAYIAKGIPGISRLTGLDPAAPLFESHSKKVQLDVGDANFVEVAHTETFPIVGYGVWRPKGHVDYYFNGNLQQPGCNKQVDADILRQLQRGKVTVVPIILDFLACSHGRALIYYNEAISDLNNCTFWGQRMNKTVEEYNELTHGYYAMNTTDLKDCTITSCSPWGIKAIDYPARGLFFVATNKKEPYCVPEPGVDSKMAALRREYESEH